MIRRRRITDATCTVDGLPCRVPVSALDFDRARGPQPLAFGGYGFVVPRKGDGFGRVRCRWSPGMRYAGGTVLDVTAERVDGVWWWVIEVSPKGAEVSDG